MAANPEGECFACVGNGMFMPYEVATIFPYMRNQEGIISFPGFLTDDRFN